MDYEEFNNEYKSFSDWNAGWFTDKDNKVISFNSDDRVNSPSHYTSGKVEAIEVIEDAIKDAPNHKVAFLQGQVLKYLLRLNLKDNPVEDARKAEWYLKRLIDSLQ